MWSYGLLYLFLINSTFHGTQSSQEYHTRYGIYETPENIQSQGYVAESHHVITRDGYILEMHRIPYKRHQYESSESRPAVLIMHGLLAASNCFIFLGREYGLAYNLADAGLDVWMGNARGTRNSRRHTTLNPDGPEEKYRFFNFTWEEIALIDLAAMTDYILENTGRENIHYIGHSQGGTIFLVLNSMIPDYNEKFASAHLLAGVGYQEHFPNLILYLLAKYNKFLYELALSVGLIEVFPPGTVNIRNNEQSTKEIISNIGLNDAYDFSNAMTAIDLKEWYDFIIEFLERSLKGLKDFVNSTNTMNNDTETEHVFIAGAGSKQIAHYGQNIEAKAFRRWDYGNEQNLRIYGTEKPPIYNLSLITVNVTMHYTVNDLVLDERDVRAMAEVMPNTGTRKIRRETFKHVDFLFSEDVKKLVTEYIIDAIMYVENVVT